jgi:phage gp36-like protein
MVQYASEGEFNSLGAPEEAFAELGSSTINLAITAASSMANSYLRKRYALPLAEIGLDLKIAVINIAKWQLLKRRGFNPSSGQDVVIADAYKDAITWLTMISRGECELDGVDATADVDEAGPLVGEAEDTDAVAWGFFTRRPAGDDCI